MSHRIRREDYTVGWVCALPIELEAAQALLDEVHQNSYRNANDTNIYTLGRIERHNVVIACLPFSQMGTNSAAAVAAQMNSTFPSIQLRLMVGIGGGVPSASQDIRLGDVVVSHRVVQYDFGKNTENGFKRTGFLNNPPTILLNAIAKLEANSGKNHFEYDSRLGEQKKFTQNVAGADRLFEADYSHIDGDTCEKCDERKLVDRKPRDAGKQVMIHYGTIASGNQVMRSAVERDRISSELGGILCYEMEAAGLMNSFPCLVIRGICDYSDSHKNKQWQPYASGTAAIYAKKVLSIVPPAEASQLRVDKPSTEDEGPLKRLPYAVDAPFNSYKKQHDPACLPNTRVDVLEKISEWMRKEDEQGLFWLNGLAGTGKSTIARTIARKAYEEGHLGASFFFSKGGGDLGTAKKFVTTIARQLASQSSILEECIIECIQQCREIADLCLFDQWHRLIIQPFSRLKHGDTFVIVIDALDECDNDGDIKEIVRLLAQSTSPSKLRVFLTSRPEVPVRRVFHNLPVDVRRHFVLHEISSETVDNDISVFFAKELQEVAANNYLDAGWPGREIIERLVHHANGLFIWAATACRFINDGHFANERLTTILQTGRSGTVAEKHLDEIYLTVFTQSISPSYSESEKSLTYSLLRYIIGTIAILSSQLSINSLGAILGIRGQDVQRTLNDLHAIFAVPEDPSHPVHLHHPSLRDFLLDGRRCTDPNLHVDEIPAHRKLFINCIKLMSDKLKRDICGLNAPGALLRHVTQGHIEKCIPPELQYACLHWENHLLKSETAIYDKDIVHEFLKEHLLHWLEALSLMENVSESILIMNSLISLTSENNCPQLHAFIWDTIRFIQYNRHGFQQAPLQLYFSALVFIPVRSVVRNQFKDQANLWVKQLPNVQDNWSSCLQTLEGHTTGVEKVVFSPDGKMLVSICYTNIIRLWDTTTGQCLRILEGYHGMGYDAQAFILSPHGEISIATSGDGYKIQLRDVMTNRCLHILEGHTDLVSAIFVGPNGSLLASVSDDDTIRLWDTSTGHCLQTIVASLYLSSKIVFKSDGKMIAFRSNLGPIQLRDTTTGKCLQTFEIAESLAFSSLAFKQNEEIFAFLEGFGEVSLWNIATGQYLQHIRVNASIHNIEFDPTGNLLASLGDNSIQIWDATNFQCLQILQGHSGGIIALACNPDGKTLASGSYDSTVRLWDITSGQQEQALQTRRSSRKSVFSLNTKVLASILSGGVIELHDIKTGQCLRSLHCYTNFIDDICFSPDGKSLASALHDGKIYLWDVMAGQCLHVLDVHEKGILRLLFVSDGKILVHGLETKTFSLWNIKDGKSLHVLECTDNMADVFGFYGGILATILFTPRSIITLWDITTGQRLQILDPHSTNITALAFILDGRLLASASKREILFWDTKTGQCLYKTDSLGTVLTLSISSDNRYMNTEKGRIPLHPSLFEEWEEERHVSHELYVTNDWITLDGREFLWLPPEYRMWHEYPFFEVSRLCAILDEHTIALECRPGRAAPILELTDLAIINSKPMYS
ncbi:WD40-repeat-containing domain protein [Talaromyces proteolyticus]|uniref:WD40-repeat-containing domain protein n=1 Tax=Talaromyces proteolyticus TaxID=1131652 RepID=A0AAD4L2T2_9EURO|nr:WD40-repeat-containing domain protein [Talaromyces proteolyticus]KAH8705555.1 WD40-repeat-containing domain protein [Talaromyces proteolyticus]